jgi:hypothetical protein
MKDSLSSPYKALGLSHQRFICVRIMQYATTSTLISALLLISSTSAVHFCLSSWSCCLLSPAGHLAGFVTRRIFD